jgi:hypothetical protein
MVGGKNCTCGDVLNVGVVHHFDGTPCYVIRQEDLNYIIDGVTAAYEEMMGVGESEKETARPCDRTFTDSAGNEWTPDLINKYASKAEALATYICENEKYLKKDDIVQICDAVRDNWKRYWASC